MPKTMFDIIKKQNGETFAKAIRNYDNGIFDIPNLDKIVKYAGRQAEPIMSYLVSLKGVSIEEMSVHRNPIDLLDKAGYKAWYVNDVDTPEKSVEDCERDQNAIAGYFRSAEAVEHGYTGKHPRTNVGNSEHGELICTIYTNLGSAHKQRFKDYYIINAVKKEVDGDDKLPEEQWHIKPSDNPEREDEYGTSVISIQIVKTGGFISIKNRYNHTVNCPDDTFDNNPDKIILGLTNSLRKYFNVEFNVSEKILPDNYIFVGDRLVQYNRELNNIYFGSNYYVKGSEIIKLKPESQIMLDFIVFDMENKTMFTPNNNDGNTYKVLSEAFSGKKIQRKKDNDKIILSTEDGNRIVVKNGNIIGLSLPNIKEIPDDFMSYPNSLEYIELPNVKKIGNKVLSFHNAIKSINFPKVEEIGDSFLYVNNCLETVIMPCVKKIGVCFLRDNRFVKSIDMPDVEDLGNCFLDRNEILTSVNLPKVKRIGNFFLEMNNSLKTLDLPKVKKIGSVFMSNNNTLISLKIPNVKDIDNIGDFLENNKSLVYIEMPEKFKNLAENLLKRNKFKKVTNKVREKIRQTAISVFTDIKQNSIEKTTR